MRLLIVEDNGAQTTSYRDVIAALNTANPGELIDPNFVTSLADAKEALKAGEFDAAVVDLKLSGEPAETEGNEVIREIVGIRRFPVFVYSAHIGDIDTAIVESIFFQKFEKTGALSFEQIVIKLHGIYKTGVTKILGTQGSIETRLTDIFWKNISGSFESLMKQGVTEEQLLRYISGHLFEHLEMNGAGGFDNFLPEEVYIQPSIKGEFFTGSIIKNKASQKYYIILTPQCDMAHSKTTSILAAEIRSGVIGEYKGKLQAPVPTTMTPRQAEKRTEEHTKLKDKLKQLITNSGSPKYYFLPKSHWFDGGLVHFQDLTSIDPAHIGEQFDLVAAISAPFLRDIVSKFAHYYSRQGSPDLKYSLDDLLAS